MSGLDGVAEANGSASPRGAPEQRVLEQTAAFCRMFLVYDDFLRAESGSADGAEMRRVAHALEGCVSEVGVGPGGGENASWIAASLLEASAHAYAAAGDLTEADTSYRAALEAISKSDDANRVVFGSQIAESLYANLCRLKPSDAIREIARRDATAAAWTAMIESHRDPAGAGISAEANSALEAFEQDCFQRGAKEGWLQFPYGGAPSDSGRARREADEALARAGMPAFDAVGFDISPTSRLSSAATVLLLHGRNSGFALIVPPRAALQDAVRVELPDYSSRVADRLGLERKEGWVPALLEWRHWQPRTVRPGAQTHGGKAVGVCYRKGARGVGSSR